MLEASKELVGRDPLRGLYELSWYVMSEFETDNTEHAAAQLVDLSRYPRVSTKEFLFDYRNAIGTMLMHYLIKKARPSIFDREGASQVLDVVREWRWHESTGEVMFAYSLLSKEGITDSETKELVNLCKSGIQEALSNDLDRSSESNELGWKLLTLNLLDEQASKEMFMWIGTHIGNLEDMIERLQMDALSPLLWAYSAFGNRSPREVIESLVPEIARRLLGQVREVQDLSFDPELVTKLVTAMQLAKEGLIGQAKHELGMVVAYEDGKLSLDLSTLNVGLPRISYLSKAKIALTMAGFYHPFMLSSGERELYHQILIARNHGTKFVRKYELGIGLLAGGAVVSVLAADMATAFNLTGWIQWTIVGLALGAYSDVAWGVWNEGAITRQSLGLALRRIQGYLSPSG